jgi:hypothetical protein
MKVILDASMKQRADVFLKMHNYPADPSGINDVRDSYIAYMVKFAMQELGEATADSAPGLDALEYHYVLEIRCDHEAKTDQIVCACMSPLPVCSSVGEAVKSWADHVRRRATLTNEPPAPGLDARQLATDILASCALRYIDVDSQEQIDKAIDLAERILRRALTSPQPSRPAAKRMMVKHSGGEPHEECPDCRGECSPVKPEAAPEPSAASVEPPPKWEHTEECADGNCPHPDAIESPSEEEAAVMYEIEGSTNEYTAVRALRDYVQDTVAAERSRVLAEIEKLRAEYVGARMIVTAKGKVLSVLGEASIDEAIDALDTLKRNLGLEEGK